MTATDELSELVQRLISSHAKMCTQRGSCTGCYFYETTEWRDACPYIKLYDRASELGVEVEG